MNEVAQGNELSIVLIQLMKGVVYRDDSGPLWQTLIELQGRIADHVSVLGLQLLVDETEGCAYLTQAPISEGAVELPRLVPRRPLSYPVSLLLVLLRKKLAEFDASTGETRLVLTRDQIAELVRVFLPETSNEARFMDRLDVHLGKLTDLGFLRRLRAKQPEFEVRRILKAFVDAQWLSDFDQRLAAYKDHDVDGKSE